MSKNTKIDWCDVTWNTSDGCRNREEGNCPLGKKCYSARMMKRFPKRYPHGMATPTIKWKKMDLPLSIRKPSRIFVNSMGDTFGSWQTDSYITKVFKVIGCASQHRYLFLTKNPLNMQELLQRWMKRHGRETLPWNCWFGVSITSERDAWKVGHLHRLPTQNTFVSVEPLWGDVTSADFEAVKWVIVGAETPVTPKTFPIDAWEKLEKFLFSPDAVGITIFLKKSMKIPLRCQYVRQDYPKGLRRLDPTTIKGKKVQLGLLPDKNHGWY